MFNLSTKNKTFPKIWKATRIVPGAQDDPSNYRPISTLPTISNKSHNNNNRSLIKTLVDRTFKINNTYNGFKIDLKNIINILKRNSFPAFVIDNVVKRYHSKNIQIKHSSGLNAKDAIDSKDVRYFKLPFIGQFSKVTQLKINNFCKRFL